MFLVQISSELQITTFNRKLSDLIGQYSAINLMGDLMDDQSLTGDGKTMIEMISDQVPILIRDLFDRPSNVHGKTGPKTKKIKHENNCKQVQISIRSVRRGVRCLWSMGFEKEKSYEIESLQ